MKLSVASILLLAAPGVLGFSQTSLRSKASTSLFAEKYKVFIDGEAGTTGIQVRGRLEKREDLEIISPPSDLRKDVDTRKKFINDADVVILCTLEYLKTATFAKQTNCWILFEALASNIHQVRTSIDGKKWYSSSL